MTDQSGPVNSGDLAPDPDVRAPHATKTPLFEANHAARYQRQTLISELQSKTTRSLICYVSGSQCLI